MGLFKKYNLFDLFDDFSKNEVLNALELLNDYEKSILKRRFGINYDGYKSDMFSAVDHVSEIYMEIIPKIKNIVLENRNSKVFNCNELIPCINSGRTNEYLCNKFNLTREQLYKELTKLRNNGINIKNKYYSDGTINFESYNIKERNTNKVPIITAPKENYMKVLAISDLHFGSEKERLDLVNKAFDYCIKNNINIILCCGDFIDGTFSSEKIKIPNPYDQIQYFLDNYPKDNNILTFAVGGDHDLSAFNLNGISIIDACKNNRSDIIIPGYNNVDINIKNDNIHLFHSLQNGKMIYTPSFVCLHGHSHKFIYSERNGKININIPTLSNIMQDNPGIVELSFSFYKGYVSNLNIKHISIEDEKVLFRKRCDLSNRNVEHKSILNIDSYYERR